MSLYLQHFPPFCPPFVIGLPRPSTFILPPSLGSSRRSFWSCNDKVSLCETSSVFFDTHFFRLEHEFSYSSKHLLHVDVVLSGSLKQSDPHLVCKSLSVVCEHHLRHQGKSRIANKRQPVPTFLSGSSFLFPTRILFTTSQFWSISCNHLLTLAKLSPLVTS